MRLEIETVLPREITSHRPLHTFGQDETKIPGTGKEGQKKQPTVVIDDLRHTSPDHIIESDSPQPTIQTN